MAWHLRRKPSCVTYLWSYLYIFILIECFTEKEFLTAAFLAASPDTEINRNANLASSTNRKHLFQTALDAIVLMVKRLSVFCVWNFTGNSDCWYVVMSARLKSFQKASIILDALSLVPGECRKQRRGNVMNLLRSSFWHDISHRWRISKSDL